MTSGGDVSSMGMTAKPDSMKRPCSACGGKHTCRWSDDAWVCRRCGSEWYPDHNPRYASPFEVPPTTDSALDKMHRGCGRWLIENGVSYCCGTVYMDPCDDCVNAYLVSIGEPPLRRAGSHGDRRDG